MKNKETVLAREFLFPKEPLHPNCFTLNDLSLAHVDLQKICNKKMRWSYDLSVGLGVVSVAPGEVVWRRPGNRQEAGRSTAAAADKDRIHLEK